jgi:hypothetical protein
MGEVLRDARGTYKNMIAVMRVSIPVIIISLENDECNVHWRDVGLDPTIAMAEVLWCVCARCRS